MQDEQHENLMASLLNKSVGAVILPIVVGITAVVFEYAILQPVAENPNRSLLFLAICCITSLLIGFVVLQIIRLRRNRYVRETYALYAAIIFLLTVLTVGIMVTSGYLPWNVPVSIIVVISGETLQRPSPSLYEIALLLLGTYIVLTSLWRSHSNWHGCKSVGQVQREEGHDPSHLFAEAYAEFRRIIRRKKPFEIYRESELTWSVDVPTEPIESQAWKDQARELVGLISTTYAFHRDFVGWNSARPDNDERDDWHDLMGCWIGVNTDTRSTVALIPAYSPINHDRLQEQIAYARLVGQQRNRQLAEVIVAVKQGTTAPSVNLGLQDVPVRIETEHTLLERTINLEDYRSIIEQRVHSHRLPGSTLSIADTYVPVFGRVGDSGVPVNVETYLREWLVQHGGRQIALLGNYGLGKSTVSLMLTHKLLTEHERLPLRIPILIELRGRLLRNLEPEALLGQWAARYGMNGKALLRLHEAGRLLLIFEGFDEMAYLSDREMRLSYFRALWEFARYPEARILVTGRSTLFETEDEKAQALRFRRFYGEGFYGEPIELQPFTLDQVVQALRAFPSHVCSQISELASDNARFFDIISRPSLLHVVATIWDDAKFSERAHRLSSATVLEAFVQNTYHRQIEKERKPGEFMLLKPSERAYFMSGIATYMATNRLVTINNQDLGILTLKLLDVMPAGVSIQETESYGITAESLKRRIIDLTTGEPDPRKLERIKTEVRSNALLDNDPTLVDTFKFGHKSFQEFLFAEAISEYILHKEDVKARTLVTETGSNIRSIFQVPESVVFLAELLVRDDQVLREKISDQLTNMDLSLHHLFAERLLENIAGPWREGLLLRRLRVFVASIYYLLMSLQFGFVLLTTVIVLALLSLLNIDLPLWGNVLVISFVYFVVGSVIIKYLFRRLNSLHVDIEIWSRICASIGISDDVLHKVVGTSRIYGIRKLKFRQLVQYPEDTDRSGMGRMISQMLDLLDSGEN